MDCLRIAMWSGPRNISTALMRAFENRADCAVVDEPFYAAYLAATGIDHPGREEILASQSQEWATVAKALCRDAPAPIYYQKHMTQHLLPGADLRFSENLHNCFLIRDPRRIIVSYAKVRAEFDLEELGFPQQQRLFERECDRLGEAPPVLDAERVLADPRGVLGQLCEKLGIAFDERMLSWPPGPRASDGVWAPHWYASVRRSTGFAAPPADAPGGGDQLSKVQLQLCEKAQRSYEVLRPYALDAMP